MDESERISHTKNVLNALKKVGAIFVLFVYICPFGQMKRPPKLEAFTLKILKLALYARGDSNPQPLAPEANDVLFTSHCFYIT